MNGRCVESLMCNKNSRRKIHDNHTKIIRRRIYTQREDETRYTTTIYVHGRMCSGVLVRVGARTSVDANIEDSNKAKKGMGQPPTAKGYVWQQCWDRDQLIVAAGPSSPF